MLVSKTRVTQISERPVFGSREKVDLNFSLPPSSLSISVTKLDELSGPAPTLPFNDVLASLKVPLVHNAILKKNGILDHSKVNNVLSISKYRYPIPVDQPVQWLPETRGEIISGRVVNNSAQFRNYSTLFSRQRLPVCALQAE